MTLIRSLLSAAFLLSAIAQTKVGPPHGSLIVVGGGALGPEIKSRFVELAGGVDAPVVVIPTANDGEPKIDPAQFPWNAGMTNVTMLHTRDKQVADTEAFTAPLRKARAVWIPGGRQWRLVDSYLHTAVQKELFALLDRGGVIAGSSAGATIQGSYLVRGAREGNTLMMAPGYEEGFGFLRGVAVDQHVITRHREKDLQPVIEAHPNLLGIGLDESTAIVVQGDQFSVIGKSKVAIWDSKYRGANGEPYFTVSAGDRFDLGTRRILPVGR